jgi:hypothetical protein
MFGILPTSCFEIEVIDLIDELDDLRISLKLILFISLI